LFFVPRFAGVNCLVPLLAGIYTENRDNRLPQEKADYRWPTKNEGDKF